MTILKLDCNILFVISLQNIGVFPDRIRRGEGCTKLTPLSIQNIFQDFLFILTILKTNLQLIFANDLQNISVCPE